MPTGALGSTFDVRWRRRKVAGQGIQDLADVPLQPVEIAPLLRAVAASDRILTRLEASGYVPMVERDEAIADPRNANCEAR